ncbi:isoprenoid synthase domain-containing protein [Bombardia bombarda]|uniref:Isoprenoid synthase domain-containing protein n=1 Tax=Bombardia bombarda TaxID=252184 RepID=A0AA39XJS7_9PEZI|nr:isoprenoid synthase domain-containing protein [Bombardia bombarda]
MDTVASSSSSATPAAAPPPKHLNPFLQSPTAIPPRTSSTFSTGGIHNTTTSSSSTTPQPIISSKSALLRPTYRPHKTSKPQGLGHISLYCHGATPPPPSPPPTSDPSRFATEDFSARRPWLDDKEKVLTGPYDYLNDRPGKDFRAQLVKAFDAWLDVPKESLDVITKAVGMLHTASLLVDDVEDSSILRRGLPVAHSIFGVAQTINSSNYIYFTALQELQKLNKPEAITIFADELVNLHRGQGMDLFWRDTLTCPTEDDYLEMVSNKTGGLFRLGIKLMQVESRSQVDCIPLVNIIGLIFQILDDYKNLWSREYTANKGMCEDLTEGKFSFPVIHSIRSDPSNKQLLNILKQKTTNEEVKRYAVSYMEKTGSFEYTRQVLTALIERARKITDQVDDGKGKSGGIHKILDKLVLQNSA